MKTVQTDAVVIGGGCAGMAAALSAVESGLRNVLILERSPMLGGVLRQCVHNGFGVHRFSKDLTGTEYAANYAAQVQAAGIPVWTETFALEVRTDRSVVAMRPDGLVRIEPGVVILATGCRERPRGALLIPGSRPAGILTAGTAQRYMNLEGYLVGRRIVILGSGDIGLIMARQFVLEGAQVLAIAEIQPYSSGLTRNIVQCVEDFDIPLFYNTTVSRIVGKERLEGVCLAEVDRQRNPIPHTERLVPCDTLILSVGLIPENELARQAEIDIDPATGGARVTDAFETSIPGVFACGNALHVHDLADFVTVESEEAGRRAAQYVLGKAETDDTGLLPVRDGFGARGVVPQWIRPGAEGVVRLQFRPASKFTDCFIAVYAGETCVARKRRMILMPGEMCEVEVSRERLTGPIKVQVEV